MASFSFFQTVFIESDFSRSSESAFSRAASRSRALAESSFSSAFFSISAWRTFRSTSSIAVGRESISIFRREAASSTRSIALSGRKRSAM